MEAPADAAALLSRRASPTYFDGNNSSNKLSGPSTAGIAYSTASDLPSRSASVSHDPTDEEKHSLLHKDRSGAVPAPRLLLSSEVPAWYAANQHIRSGYRPITPSVRFCLTSLGSLHNETVNIYSHLIPCTLALTGNYALYEYFSARLPNALLADRLVFHIFLTGSVVCFGVSAAYHALLCHSKQYHDLWLRLDYVSIIVQILGSFVSGIYMGFYCEPGPRAFHWGMIGTLSAFTCFVMLHPRFQSQEYRIFRLWTFVLTGLSGFAPVFHAMTMFPYDQLVKHMGVQYYYLEGVFILTGALIYGIHFPEKWSPFKFDIFGASHQIFHICVVLGAVSHFCGILSAFEYTYNHPRCF